MGNKRDREEEEEEVGRKRRELENEMSGWKKEVHKSTEKDEVLTVMARAFDLV